MMSKYKPHSGIMMFVLENSKRIDEMLTLVERNFRAHSGTIGTIEINTLISEINARP